MTEEVGLWLYAVARDLDAGALAGLTGVARTPVHPVAARGMTAIASPVPLSEFGEDALRHNLENLDWLAATARAHDAVVAAVNRLVTAIPLRLATVYLDEVRVRTMLDERRSDLRVALELVSGRTEWGVKAYADPETPARAVPPATPSAGRAGTAYLLRRREQLSARDEAARTAMAHGQRLHDTLASIAVAARRHPLQDPKLSGQPGWMVLNGAYLVDDARADEFAAAVRHLHTELPDVRIELTGPWSPYSFAGMPS
jgi:hypothetical protein